MCGFQPLRTQVLPTRFRFASTAAPMIHTFSCGYAWMVTRCEIVPSVSRYVPPCTTIVPPFFEWLTAASSDEYGADAEPFARAAAAAPILLRGATKIAPGGTA